MMAVISITVNIILLVVFSLFSEFLVALDRYVWPISIILWCTLFFGFYLISRGEDPRGRAEIMAVPFAGIPSYVLLLISIPDLFKGDPFCDFLGIMVALPLSLCFSILLGIGSTLLAGKLPTKLVVPASLVFNVLATIWLVSIGV